MSHHCYAVKTSSLGRRGINVIVISDTDSSANLYSRYISQKWFFNGKDSALVEYLLEKHGLFKKKPVLFPVRDATVLALADRLSDIHDHFCLAMPEAATVKNTLCKTTFSKMAEEMGLPIPKSLSVENSDDISQISGELRFPIIIKPEYRNDSYIKNVSGKAFIAQNLDELLRYYSCFSRHQAKAILQEYIPGKDTDLYFCFQYYKTNGNLAASLCGRKIRQYPPSSGSTSSCEVVSCPKVEEITTSFFKNIKYVGPCSMEFKRDLRTGKFYLIEPTIGRADWNNAFAEGNGIPIPFINYLDALGMNVPEYTIKKVRRKWIRWSSDFESSKTMMKKGDLTTWAWFRSICPPVTGAIFAFDDPVPVFIKILRRIRRKISKHWKGKIYL